MADKNIAQEEEMNLDELLLKVNRSKTEKTIEIFLGKKEAQLISDHFAEAGRKEITFRGTFSLYGIPVSILDVESELSIRNRV